MWRSRVTCQLLRSILSTVADTGTHHWHVHLDFESFDFEEKIQRSLELSILAQSPLNSSHNGTVHKVRLDQVRDDPWFIPDNAAPEGGPDLLCMAEIG